MKFHSGDDLSTTTAPPTTVPAPAATHNGRSVAMVFACTLLGAAAQMLFKAGLRAMPHPSILAVLTNWPLLAGLTCYGFSTLLLVMALRHGELSLLYPVISLTYAWVTILSVILLRESINPFKALGLATIIFGVCLLGRGAKK